MFSGAIFVADSGGINPREGILSHSLLSRKAPASPLPYPSPSTINLFNACFMSFSFFHYVSLFIVILVFPSFFRLQKLNFDLIGYEECNSRRKSLYITDGYILKGSEQEVATPTERVTTEVKKKITSGILQI